MGAYTEIVDFTVPSNTQSVVLTDFGTITKDDFVKVVTTFVNPVATLNVIGVFANNATTNTDYHTQELEGGGSTVAAQRNARNFWSLSLASSTSSDIGYLKISENDRFNWFSNNTFQNGSSVFTHFAYGTSSNATFTTGITTLRFTSLQTNGIGTGSRIQIYKLAAEKVADITVASNTTQVDISNLSIDKDSEYLLVSDVVKGATGAQTTELFVNDDTTSTNYHSQRIFGNGSSATATRFNSAFYMSVLDSNRHLGYTHIKLSNIGAFTAQSYTISDVGSSLVTVRNHFISSTSEAITSITKLNIKQIVTNGIGTGSRFTLYKLYE